MQQRKKHSFETYLENLQVVSVNTFFEKVRSIPMKFVQEIMKLFLRTQILFLFFNNKK